MSTLANALTTKEKVKSYLSLSGTGNDVLIDMLIDQATAFIENYCGGRKFLSQSYTDVVDTKGGDKLFFENYPVTALTSVKYRSGTPSSPIWNVYNVDTYLLYNKAGYVKFFGLLPVSSQGIQLVYTAGYLIDFTQETNPAFHTLPNDLAMACTMFVASLFQSRQAQGVSQLRTEGQEIRYKDLSEELPPSVKTILSQYQTFRYAV